MLAAEIAACEVVSAFNARDPGTPHSLPFWFGPSLHLTQNTTQFDNLWSVWRREHETHSPFLRDAARSLDDLETGFYGLKPFSRRGDPSSDAEVRERGVYALVNLLRFEAGSPLYGDISLVLSPASAARYSLISPFDTGSWTVMCNTSRRPWKPSYPHNCSAFPSSNGIGVLNHTVRSLLLNEQYWQSPQAFLRKVERLFSPHAKPAPLSGTDFVHYIEAVPAATLRFSSDIRFVIADFSSLFGAAIGAELQRWAARQGWPLTWSLGLNLGPMTKPRFWSAGTLQGPFGSEPYPRLIDPTVAIAVSVNVSVTKADSEAFASAWASAKAVRGSLADANRSVSFVNSTFNASDWAVRWRSLREHMSGALRVAPLHRASCLELERCFGVAALRDACVCVQ